MSMTSVLAHGILKEVKFTCISWPPLWNWKDHWIIGMVGTIVTLGKSKSRKPHFPYDYPKNKHSQFQFHLETVDKSNSVTCPLLNPIIIIIIIIIMLLLLLLSLLLLSLLLLLLLLFLKVLWSCMLSFNSCYFHTFSHFYFAERRPKRLLSTIKWFD